MRQALHYGIPGDLSEISHVSGRVGHVGNRGKVVCLVHGADDVDTLQEYLSYFRRTRDTTITLDGVALNTRGDGTVIWQHCGADPGVQFLEAGTDGGNRQAGVP